MFRSALVRSLRASAPRAVRIPVARQITSLRAVRPSQFAPCLPSQALRFYSASAGLSKDEVEGRIVNLLKNFDKVRLTELLIEPISFGRELLTDYQVNDASKVSYPSAVRPLNCGILDVSSRDLR